MVEIRGLFLDYPLPGAETTAALAGINARFEAGGISAIIGPSGCGKTSLIHAMAGLRRPSAGEVLIEGRPLLGVRKKTACVFQDYGLLPWKTVRANAELPLKIAGVPGPLRRERAGLLLGEFGLAPFEKRYPRQLSGGMQQRLAIVRALAAEPDLLRMDEPFSSLDALTREEAQDFLLAVQAARPLTIVIVTHSIEEAVYLAEKVFVMTGKNPGTMAEGIEVPRNRRKDPWEDRRGSPEFQALCGKLRETLKNPAAVPNGVRHQKTAAKNGVSHLLGIALTVLGFAGLWALAAALLQRPFLPGPLTALRALIRLGAAGTLGRHLGASLSRILWALVTSFIPAAALGLAAGRSPPLNAVVSPVIYLLHPLPKAAFLPIIMLILGLGEASKIFLVGFIIFSQILVTARDAAHRVNRELIASVRSLGAGPWGVTRQVILPATLPDLFTGLRVSLGTAVAVLFLAETFATSRGLGYLIIDAWTRIAYGEMYAAILALSLLGLGLFVITDALERICCPWEAG
jgi:ABC-type nitrate/sulfonate/bicarbonate transport system ATPase subunit/ABC-type nitrate/sulfonate/bicarbonate transport system permease component